MSLSGRIRETNWVIFYPHKSTICAAKVYPDNHVTTTITTKIKIKIKNQQNNSKNNQTNKHFSGPVRPPVRHLKT